MTEFKSLHVPIRRFCWGRVGSTILSCVLLKSKIEGLGEGDVRLFKYMKNSFQTVFERNTGLKGVPTNFLGLLPNVCMIESMYVCH